MSYSLERKKVINHEPKIGKGGKMVMGRNSGLSLPRVNTREDVGRSYESFDKQEAFEPYYSMGNRTNDSRQDLSSMI